MLLFFQMEGAEHISHAAVHLQPWGFLWAYLSGDVPVSHKINKDHAESIGKKIKKLNKRTKYPVVLGI